MTKYNMTITLTKNGQTVQMGATDIELKGFIETETTLIKHGSTIINTLIPGEDSTISNSTYTPVSNPGGAIASQKQVNFLHALGYGGDCSNLTVSQANDLIKEYKMKK